MKKLVLLGIAIILAISCKKKTETLAPTPVVNNKLMQGEWITTNNDTIKSTFTSNTPIGTNGEFYNTYNVTGFNKVFGWNDTPITMTTSTAVNESYEVSYLNQSIYKSNLPGATDKDYILKGNKNFNGSGSPYSYNVIRIK